MDGAKRIAMIADAAFAALTGIIPPGEYKRRVEAAQTITKSLARAVLNVDDFDELISDLRQVLWVYSIPKPPELATETVSSPRAGGAA